MRAPVVSGPPFFDGTTVAAVVCVAVAATGVALVSNAGETSIAWRRVARLVCVALAVGWSGAALGLVLTSGRWGATQPPAVALVACGALASTVLVSRTGRRVVTRWAPRVDPDSVLHAAALAALGVGLATVGLAHLAATNARSGRPQLVFASDAAAFFVALSGVGTYVRRSPQQCADRLGVRRITPRDCAVVTAAGAAAFFGFACLNAIIPGARDTVPIVTTRTVPGLSQGLLPALGCLVASAAGEEILFRGALRPRIGNALSSAAFAVWHAQRVFGFATAELLVLSYLFGRVWTRRGVVACVLGHAAYIAAATLAAR